MTEPFDAAALTRFHDRYLAAHAEPPAQPLWRWVAENHRCNSALWREEDRARRDDVPATDIVRCKRNIDRYNQRRNDAVEALDACLLETLRGVPPAPGSRRSSETPGAMIDRLSILALKIHHMALQARRTEAGEAHVAACREKLDRLVEQRSDLAAALDRLLDEARRGAASFKVYRQFKMYNDPQLNPELYAAAKLPQAAQCDVLIPTYERPAALAATLTALYYQSVARFRVVVSDQGEIQPAEESAEVRSAVRLLRARGCEVELHRHRPRRGLAEQRHYLLAQARTDHALFLDDDVVLEADQIERLLRAIRAEGCGFVGAAVIGLSYADDVRPQEQRIEFWEGPVTPEQVLPGTEAWERHRLHSAANLLHLQQRLALPPGEQRLYRVAWVGGCVMFDVAKLRAVGGFEFWQELPSEHCGEDVLAQLRVMARYGGCAVIPSGAYHQELPTTVTAREVDAPKVLSVAG